MLVLFTSHESRLFYALALNLFVLWCAWRAARQVNPDPLDAAGDAGLLFYLVQYLAVCTPGLVGALHPLTSGAVAVFLSGAMALYGSRRDTPAATAPPPRKLRSRILVIASAAFVIGYMVCLIVYERLLPPTSNDAITYHLSAAVQWLQTGRVGLYEAWFYNPANSFSPLGGSVFIEWLIAPLRNDMLARFVQAGPLLLLFIAMMNVGRRLGADAGVAAMIAAAAVLARPLIGQTILAKDDLFVAAFFILSLDALTRQRLGARLGSWRAGVALGLLLATKYTVLLSTPALLLMLGRPFNVRRMLTMLACIMLLAGPWYLRNLILTGNPLYPTRVAVGSVTIFPGMLRVHRSDLLASASGAWQVFTGGYYSIPLILACAMIAGWLGAIVTSGRNVWRDPLVRTCTIGAALGIALFVGLAPYGEMRFAYPSLLLIFAAACLALTRLPCPLQTSAAALMVGISAATAFVFHWARHFMIAGAIAALLTAGIVAVIERWPVGRKVVAGLAAAACLAGMMYAYVNWAAYVRQCETDSTAAWSLPPPHQYGELGDAWRYVRDELPKGSTIAYANTYYTYPLMGFAYDRRVVYAPTRSGLGRFLDMPPIEEDLTGEQIVGKVAEMLRQHPDREQWLRRLRFSAAEYLVVAKKLSEMQTASPPPELTFAREIPGTFQQVFDNESATIFRIRW